MATAVDLEIKTISRSMKPRLQSQGTPSNDMPRLLYESTLFRAQPATTAAHFDSLDKNASCAESNEGGGYILTAHGEIPLSNLYFLPGPHSDESPSASPDHRMRTPPPKMKKVPLHRKEYALPSLIQNIRPRSSSTAAVSPETEFRQMMQQRREATESDAGRRVGSPPPSKDAQKGIEKLDTRVNESITAVPPVSPTLSARGAAVQPKYKYRPLRGYAPLPPRPRLPRWDLIDPATYGK